MGTGAVRSLDFHAAYRCRHSGACCTSNWPIPVEADRAARIRGAIATGALRFAGPATALDGSAHPDTTAILPLVDGHCAFFDADGGRLWRHQRGLGTYVLAR